MANMQNMMKQMQKMQRNMAQLQEELAKTPVEGTAGGDIKYADQMTLSRAIEGRTEINY